MAVPDAGGVSERMLCIDDCFAAIVLNIELYLIILYGFVYIYADVGAMQSMKRQQARPPSPAVPGQPQSQAAPPLL